MPENDSPLVSSLSNSPGGLPAHLRPFSIAAVLTGGAIGTAARYGAELVFPHGNTGWPTGTFLVNLIGTFILGALLETLVRRGPDDGWRRLVRLLVGTGFCGAFTTYSSLALEISLLGRANSTGMAAGYAAATTVGGVLTAWLGIVGSAKFHAKVTR